MLTKGTVFTWGEAAKEEFESLKNIVAKSKWVTPFNVDLKTRLLVDSSKITGIGYILLQESGEILPSGEPKLNMVKCNSIAPNASWKWFSPLEMELMGLFWATANTSYYILSALQHSPVLQHTPALQYTPAHSCAPAHSSIP